MSIYVPYLTLPDHPNSLLHLPVTPSVDAINVPENLFLGSVLFFLFLNLTIGISMVYKCACTLDVLLPQLFTVIAFFSFSFFWLSSEN